MGWSRYINMPGATIFILIQVVLLIDFAYSVSETLLGWWEDTEDRRYIGLLLFLTGSCYIASIIVTIFMYIWFGSSEVCHHAHNHTVEESFLIIFLFPFSAN